MLLRRKKSKSTVDLSVEDSLELVRSNMQYAEQCASEGNVSGMEMALEVALEQGRKIGHTFPERRISEIKLMGYERGVAVLESRIQNLEAEGKSIEAQRLQMLLETYSNEAELLRHALP